MSSESHGVLTERTSCAINAFLFLWPEIDSWYPFKRVLWTFYQYEVIVTQYIRLVIQAIQSSVCKAEAPKNGFPKMGDQKIESLCVSWWSLLLVVWSFFLADSYSCSIDQKHPAAPLRFRIRFSLIPPPFSFPPGRVWATLQKGPLGLLHWLVWASRPLTLLTNNPRFSGTHHRLVQQPVGSSPLHISRKKWVNSQPHASFSIGFLSPVAEICNSRKERLLFLWIRKHWENLCIELAIFFLFDFIKVR